MPTALTRTATSPGAKASVLKDLARQVLEPQQHGAPSRLSLALLARETPRFVRARSSRRCLLRRLDSVYDWVDDLDESFVAFQGPPGPARPTAART